MSEKNNIEAVAPNTKKPAKKSPSAESLLLKREHEFEAAKKALEEARQKRALELGQLCLEFGFHKYNVVLLKQKFAELAKTLPSNG